ncbi:MAG: Ig-like domain-containing protein [Bacteroidota bacterium]
MRHFLCLFYCCFLAVGVSFGTDYYVDPIGGDDDNYDGLSTLQPFKRLLKITEIELQPGDTVFLMNGTHKLDGFVPLQISESGTPEQWITFKNFRGHTPLISFQSFAGIRIKNGASYIKIEGIAIRGARNLVTLEEALAQKNSCSPDSLKNDDPTDIFSGNGINCTGPNLQWTDQETDIDEVPHHITIENCEIFDCTGSGIVFQQADYITIRNCEIYNNAWYSVFGTNGITFYQFINIDGTIGVHNVVENNLIWGNQLKLAQLGSCQFRDGSGFLIDDFTHTETGNYKDASKFYGVYSAQTLVANNVSVRNGGSGFQLVKASNIYLLNNTVKGNSYQNEGDNLNADLYVEESQDISVRNNIIIGITRLHSIFPDNTNFTYSHNFQAGPGIDEEYADCEGCFTDLPIEFENQDLDSSTPYLIVSNSVRDLGADVSEFLSSDFLSNPRPVNDGFDLGAYEITNSTPILTRGVEIGNCPKFELSSGDTFTLVADILPFDATDKSVIWESINPSIASINNEGLVTAVSPGTAVVRVTTNNGGFENTCAFTISTSGNNFCKPLDLSGKSIITYGTNQDAGDAGIEDDGNTIQISDNAWKSIGVPYEVLESTWLQFDFNSTIEGEFHSIGFDRNSLEDNTKMFTLYGTQIFGIMDFNSYAGNGWQRFNIPVGRYYTGTFDRLVFIADHDSGEGNANAYFRNITLHEGECGASVVSTEQELTEAPEVRIFPNPLEEVLFINIEGLPSQTKPQIEVMNVNGQVFINQRLAFSSNRLDISQLTAGVYIVSVKAGDSHIYQRLVKY